MAYSLLRDNTPSPQSPQNKGWVEFLIIFHLLKHIKHLSILIMTQHPKFITLHELVADHANEYDNIWYSSNSKPGGHRHSRCCALP